MPDTRYFKVQDGLQLHNDRIVIDGTFNPHAVGQVADEGSLFLQSDGVVWRKYGPADTDWSRLEIIATDDAQNQDPSSGLTVDELDVTAYDGVKWFLVVKSNATPTNRRAYEVYALNDGTTDIDYTVYAVLKVNTKPTDLEVAVDLNGGNMRLRVTASENINYSWVRVPIFKDV